MINSTCCSIMKTRVQIPTPISSSSQCLWLQNRGTHALFSPVGHRHLHIHLNQTLKEIIGLPIAIPQPQHQPLPHEGSILPSSRQLSLGSELDYSMIQSLSRHKSLALVFTCNTVKKKRKLPRVAFKKNTSWAWASIIRLRVPTVSGDMSTVGSRLKADKTVSLICKKAPLAN